MKIDRGFGFVSGTGRRAPIISEREWCLGEKRAYHSSAFAYPSHFLTGNGLSYDL